jgi:hypothetical protein
MILTSGYAFIHLQHLALHRAVLLVEEALDLARRDLADLDRAGHRGEVGRRRGDLPVEDHHRDAGGLGVLDLRLQGVEVDRGEDDGGGLGLDDVVHLPLLDVGLVVGVQRLHLVADILHELLDGRDGGRLELVEERRHEVDDLALVLGERGCRADRESD